MPEERTCKIHGEKLWWHEGRDGREGWYSHKTTDPKYPKGYCNGRPPPQPRPPKEPTTQGPNMYQIRMDIVKACNIDGAGIDWNQVAKVQGYVMGGIIPQANDPFPPEAA